MIKKHCATTINEQAKGIILTETIAMGKRLGSPNHPANISNNELISTIITEIYTNKSCYPGLLLMIESKITAVIEKRSWVKYFKNKRG